MSMRVDRNDTNDVPKTFSASASPLAVPKPQLEQVLPGNNYKGFIGGIFSGIAKLSVGHPFDTVKVRLQTSSKTQFSGPLDCVLQTVRNEGIAGFYKGATPPLIGWMASDAVMLGSLTIYRKFLLHNVFANPAFRPDTTLDQLSKEKLPAFGHGIAGMMAGLTVSFVACPIEHVKARLQVQYAANKRDRFYSGPIDCARRLLRTHGLRGGLYHGLFATSLFRCFFFFWWSSYDIFTRTFVSHTNLSTPAVNFWAGGLSAQVFWLTAYPADIVKQRIMTDPLGGALRDGERRFPRWRDAVREVYREGRYRGFWRGFAPCFLRAFPANAAALVAFEWVMRSLPD